MTSIPVTFIRESPRVFKVVTKRLIFPLRNRRISLGSSRPSEGPERVKLELGFFYVEENRSTGAGSEMDNQFPQW